MKKYVIISLISFLVFTMFIGGGAYYYLDRLNNNEEFDNIVKENPDLKPPNAEDKEIVNVLFMGIDDLRSDVMILARYNKENDKVSMVSIPRDTRVKISNYGFDKINSAVARKEGIPLAMETVSSLLGVPVHYYVELTFEGMKNVVDIIGGVKLDVARDMNYKDPIQDLYINIKKGEQILNGKKSLDFVRFRSGYIDQDLGRIKAQQDFIKAFLAQITSPRILPKAFSILNEMSKNVKTNMGEKEIAYYAYKLKDLSLDNIKMYTIPGDSRYIDNISFFIYDDEKLEELKVGMEKDLGIERNASESIITEEQITLQY